MRRICLTEWEKKTEVKLTVEERDQIKKALPKAVIEPEPGKENIFQINPQDYVGIIRTTDLVVEIKPKLPIDRVLFLVTYAENPEYWREQQIVQFKNAPNLQEAIAIPFIYFVEKAFKRGQLFGYKEVDESLHQVKGKVRFSDQIKRYQRVTLPIEVTYDELTVDIEENRHILAAASKLLQLSRLSEKIKSSLRRIIRQLEFSEVTHYHYDHRSIKPIQISRLNQHYERPLALAKLILSNETIELYGESTQSTGLLFNMAKVFEEFVRVALRESLNLSEKEFPEKTKNLYLDNNKKVQVHPDLSWWRQGECVLVGDVKYKETNPTGKRPDLYQLLSFAVAANVDKAFLIYAAGEVDNLRYQIREIEKELIVETLELGGDPASILAEVEAIARKFRKSCSHQSSSLEAAHLLGI